MSRFKRSIFIVLALALMFSSAVAQAPTGKVVGKVTDNQGVPLPGVTITADSTKLVGQANAVTDDTGVYRIFSLPAGTYAIRFTLPGFRPLTRREIIVQLEQTVALNVSLEQSTIAEDITVIGQSPLIDVKSTIKGSTMTKDVFMQLPRSRDFTGLLATVPGVQYEDNQGGLSVDGASGTENMFYVDGTNINALSKGLQAQSIAMEMVDEVKVTASGYSADFGGSMGGVVNVITRSGGNSFHGDMYGYYNNQTLLMQGKSRDYYRIDPYATRPYTAASIEKINSDDLYYDGGKNRDDYQRFEGIFSLGGFIFKDRLWFYGSFNPVYGRTFGDRWFTVDPVDLTKATKPGDIKNDPRQGRQMYNDFYQKDLNLNGQVKLTLVPLKGMRMSVSWVNNSSTRRGSVPAIAGTSSKYYSYKSDWNPINPSTGLGLLTAGKQYGFDYPNWSGSGNIDYTVSNNFLVNFRAGYFFTNTENQQLFVPGTYYGFNGANTAYAEIPDSLKHSSGWNNGAGTTVTKQYITNRLSSNLDLTYYLNLAGEHAFKAGVQFIRLAENVDASRLSPVVTLFWDQEYPWYTGEKVKGKYGYYEIRGDFNSVYGNFWNIHSNNWAIYLQDSWTIGDRLTLNYGLRTESEYVPSMATGDPQWENAKPIFFHFADKMAPRLGAVYDVFGDSSLKVFGSFGLYYDVMKLYQAEG
ncbi:MAG: TonB-dependent receptor [Candidatus Aminicenantes bacterium]|nr:TonB-dependent receptor [Candidatus Aminicenantes bacterium]